MRNILLTEHLTEGTLTIRYPNKDDAPAMLAYINAISKERTFIIYQGEELTLEFEQNYLDSVLKKIAERKEVLLLAYINETLIGVANIRSKENIANHQGVIGISIAKEFRGKHIGKKLISVLLQEARTIPTLKLLTLEVFANNVIGRNLYESFGFIEYGRLPEGVQYRGEYVDMIEMYKSIN